jgi:ABC-type spermidine/putrescine transport system permease subunit II
MIRGGLSPTINALSTIILIFSSIMVSVYTYVKVRANK